MESRMKIKLLSLVIAGCFGAAAVSQNADKKAEPKLDGVWVTVTLEYNGKDMSQKYPFRFNIKGNDCVIEGNDAVKKEYAKLKFKFDPTTTPKSVDITVAGGVQKDAVIEGIYEVKDGQLKICAKVLGNERPTKFESPGGSSVVLLVMKREP
jgi:uncharacterized protein (TIGR03067 family)